MQGRLLYGCLQSCHSGGMYRYISRPCLLCCRSEIGHSRPPVPHDAGSEDRNPRRRRYRKGQEICQAHGGSNMPEAVSIESSFRRSGVSTFLRSSGLFQSFRALQRSHGSEATLKEAAWPGGPISEAEAGISLLYVVDRRAGLF